MKKVVRFAAKHDIILLKEVLQQNPFSGGKWSVVADQLADTLVVDARRCRERTNLLVEYFKKEDRASLRRSGTEEEYNEKEQLLQEVRMLMDDAVIISNLEKGERKRKEFEKESAIEIRNVAMEGLAARATCSGGESQEGPKPAKIAKKESGSSVLHFLHEKHMVEMRLQEEELNFRNKQLEFEKEKFEFEKRERQAKTELESQERRSMLSLIQSLVRPKIDS